MEVKEVYYKGKVDMIRRKREGWDGRGRELTYKGK